MVAGVDPRLLVFSRLSEGCELLPGTRDSHLMDGHALSLLPVDLCLRNPKVSDRQQGVTLRETCTGE